MIGLGLLLLIIAGSGAYEAIYSLRDAIACATRPADEVLAASLARMSVMVGACFVAALIIALASIVFMRREFERRRRPRNG